MLFTCDGNWYRMVDCLSTCMGQSRTRVLLSFLMFTYHLGPNPKSYNLRFSFVPQPDVINNGTRQSHEKMRIIINHASIFSSNHHHNRRQSMNEEGCFLH